VSYKEEIIRYRVERVEETYQATKGSPPPFYLILSACYQIYHGKQEPDVVAVS